MSSCEVHYNIPVRSRTGCCIAGTAEQQVGGGVEGGGSYIPCDPVYPPEVGYLGSLAMLHPVGANYTPPTIALHVVQC